MALCVTITINIYDGEKQNVPYDACSCLLLQLTPSTAVLHLPGTTAVDVVEVLLHAEGTYLLP